jgi:hypothetical protein
MKHTKIIQPDHQSELPTSTLPDRSNLSKLYISSLSNNPTQEAQSVNLNSKIDSRPTDSTINRAFVSFLLTIPLAATYLAAVYIYNGADANIEKPNPLFPLLSFFVSGLWLLSCVIALRILAKQFYDSSMSSSTFIIIYLFFALPLIKLTYDLYPINFIGIVSTIGTWFIANYSIALYMTWSLNRSRKSSFNKIGIIMLPVFVLVILSIIL